MGAAKASSALKVQDIIQCEHCGRCLEVCPTYQVSRTETLSARGRWDLISGAVSGELTPGARYYESLSQCLHCMACSAICPKGVNVEHMVRGAKADFPQDGFHAFVRKAVFKGVLMNRPMTKTFIQAITLARRFFPVRSDRVSRHLPLFLTDLLNGFAIPHMESRSLFRKFPAKVPAAKDVPFQGTVAYFSGCFNSLIDPVPAEDTIHVLAENGFDILIPPDQTCCGAPLFFSGDREMTLGMIRKNIEVLERADRVLTSCATCGSMLRNEYPALSEDHPALSRKAMALASRTVDFAELLKGIDIRKGRIPINRRVTIHDPCDLVRGQGISNEIREVLSAIPGLEIVEMEHSARCCGGGGTFSLSHPELAEAIGEKKIQSILDTGASMVVTGCPGCILQIGRILARKGHAIPVVHPAELLAASYGYRGF